MIDRHLLPDCSAFVVPSFIHGDPMVADRWRFLRTRLPQTRNGERVLDAGCGSGAFTLGAASRGYRATGISWDETNQVTGQARARICKFLNVDFSICDLRNLGDKPELKGQFDVIINCENIEHILDDRRLMRDFAACLKPGGRLLMTAPNLYYHPMGKGDIGPFHPVEDGGHVRRGYNSTMLRELCADCRLDVEEISSCSGPVSQWLTRLGHFGRIGHFLGLPFRLFPAPLNRPLGWLLGVPDYSICMVATKPRFAG